MMRFGSFLMIWEGNSNSRLFMKCVERHREESGDLSFLFAIFLVLSRPRYQRDVN